jgi:hypothetical protein
MGSLGFSYPPGYGAKFGLPQDPRAAIYPADLYPAETLDRFRKQGVIITPCGDPQDSATDAAPVTEPSAPAPFTGGAGVNKNADGADNSASFGKRTRK